MAAGMPASVWKDRVCMPVMSLPSFSLRDEMSENWQPHQGPMMMLWSEGSPCLWRVSFFPGHGEWVCRKRGTTPASKQPSQIQDESISSINVHLEEIENGYFQLPLKCTKPTFVYIFLSYIHSRTWKETTSLAFSTMSVWFMDFPVGASGKEPTCQCTRHKRCGLDPWVGKMPWRRKWQPTAVFLPGNSHGQRNLTSFSPWGHKESDTTERLSTHTLTYILCDLFQKLPGALQIHLIQWGLMSHLITAAPQQLGGCLYTSNLIARCIYIGRPVGCSLCSWIINIYIFFCSTNDLNFIACG